MVKGSYCKSCHRYFQLRRKQDGSYFGRCPGCGRSASLEAGDEDNRLFVKTRLKAPKQERKKINVWDHWGSGRIIASLDAGTPATVLETHRYNSIKWYKIQAGGVTGWVSSSFIRQLK